MTQKGIIFTFEALLSLLLLFLLVTLIPLLSRTEDYTLEKFIFLSDAFEVLEKGYHSDFAFWAESGPGILPDTKLVDAVERISTIKGLRFYVERGNKRIPDIQNCEKDISVDRLVVTANGWKNVSFVLCKD
jgi:hypothetical protein